MSGGCVNTISAASSNLAAPVEAPPVAWLSRLRAARGYDIAVRAVGSAWFLLLALFLARKILTHAAGMSITDFGPTGWSELLANVCLFLFYMSLWWFILIRPTPAARTDGVWPSLIAFAGTYLPWSIVLFAPGQATTGRSLASSALLLIGAISMVVIISHLGRSFSITPQAQKLVRTGPYAVVRNPLYLAEEVAVLGTLLQFYSTVTLLLFFVHGLLQVRRVFYEENLLRHCFPDYDAYTRSTARLIPYVW
jgi:protein-S-isoprenylcysteine O-methyltransferase Ste14